MPTPPLPHFWFGWNDLHIAAMDDDLYNTKQCLANGADIVARDKKGNTALHLAAEQGSLRVIKELLSRSVDINDTNTDGNTPLHMAAIARRSETVAMLLELGADANIRNVGGFTAEMAARDHNAHLAAETIKKHTRQGPSQPVSEPQR